MAQWIGWAALVAAMASGLVAGVFFAFSNFVMGALARLPAAHGAAAMQSINFTVINPGFMALFMGSAVMGLGLAALGAFRLDERVGWLLLAGGLANALGSFGVTMLRNVPLNDRLVAVAADSPEGAAMWKLYLADWTLWNSVRTGFAALAMVLLVLAWRELAR